MEMVKTITDSLDGEGEMTAIHFEGTEYDVLSIAYLLMESVGPHIVDETPITYKNYSVTNSYIRLFYRLREWLIEAVAPDELYDNLNSFYFQHDLIEEDDKLKWQNRVKVSSVDK